MRRGFEKYMQRDYVQRKGTERSIGVFVKCAQEKIKVQKQKLKC